MPLPSSLLRIRSFPADTVKLHQRLTCNSTGTCSERSVGLISLCFTSETSIALRNSIEDEFHSAGDAKFLVNPKQMVFDRVFAHAKPG